MFTKLPDCVQAALSGVLWQVAQPIENRHLTAVAVEKDLHRHQEIRPGFYNSSRRTRFKIFPVPPFGSESRNSTRRGYL